MPLPFRVARWVALALLPVIASCIHTPPVPDMSAGIASPSLVAAGPRSVTLPFLLDDNRIFVEVSFVRPDGVERKALAFVNLGSGSLVLSNRLFRELGAGPGHALRMRFGAMEITIDGKDAQPESIANSMFLTILPPGKPLTVEEIARAPGGQIAAMEAPLPVEAVLPPGLLQHFTVVFDYHTKQMTIAVPGALTPDGIPVPIRVNARSGFALVDATIGGAPHALVIDNGGSFSVFRPNCSGLKVDATWTRGVGGVGEANYTMAPSGPEIEAPFVRFPTVVLGQLRLDEWDAVQMGGNGWLGGWATSLFWKRIYFDKAGEPVCGWIGGNVLKSFRLTLDYPNRMSYWTQEAPIDADELDQVGIVVERSGGAFTIAAIAKKSGKATVSGVKPGDRLLKIDRLDTASATRGEILAALHGRPGDVKPLVLERGGRHVTVNAVVTEF